MTAQKLLLDLRDLPRRLGAEKPADGHLTVSGWHLSVRTGCVAWRYHIQSMPSPNAGALGPSSEKAMAALPRSAMSVSHSAPIIDAAPTLLARRLGTGRG